MKDLTGKRITVLGAGLSGQALAMAICDLGADVFVSESRSDLSKDVMDSFNGAGIRWEVGENSDKALDCDLMVLSSGVSPKSKIIQKAVKGSIPVEGEVDFVLPRLNGKVIAITGTNGKTTTTSLTAHMLLASGYDALAVGNIGTPLGIALREHHDFFVVELSSFQLYWTKKAFFDLSMVTNLAPDHLDWHDGLENYVEAKSKVLKKRRNGAWGIVQKRDLEKLQVTGDLSILPLTVTEPSDNPGIYMGADCAWMVLDGLKRKLFSYDQVPMVGFHNMENTAMALGGCVVLGCEGEGWDRDLVSYRPPSHRCQLIASINGVNYIDDSKGTNVASTCTALESIKGKKVVILGGRGKGESYDSLAIAVKDNCRKAILLGEEKEPISRALDLVGFVDWILAVDMEEAVLAAQLSSVPDDTVLLSPACTSWDMYGSYVERGDHFCRLVLEMQEKILKR
nr:UDP-N-acetylmuramoyl-L-alanine--D-glutamate ligase [uncultured Dethiosulfovibrio sp.]